MISRNAGIRLSDIENIGGEPIAFTLNGTNYVQLSMQGLYGSS